MENKQRREDIYKTILTEKEVSVTDLSNRFNVTTMTIRRDLDILEKDGLIIRSYGKACIKTVVNHVNNFQERAIINVEAKKMIVKFALRMLEGVDSIFIDGSTTCNMLARYLPKDRHITVVTNNLNALFYLRTMKNIDLYVIGGQLAADRNNMDGKYAYQMARQFSVDLAFTSSTGFSERGIVYGDITGIDISSIIRQRAKKRVLLVDTSKYNCSGLFDYSDWKEIDCLITNKALSPSMIDVLRQNDVKVIFPKGK